MSVTFALGIFTACDNADLIPSDSKTNQEQTIDDNGNNDNPTQDHTHVYNETVVNPTCTEQGYTLHSCTICSYDYKDTYTAALGHNYEWTTTKAPTETEKGIETGVCSRCKGTTTRDIPELNHEHNYTETVIAPNCTDKGYTLHKCSCGAEYRTNETAALGHTPAAALEENRINAICTQNGSYDSVIRCSVCHTELSRENKIIPAKGHEFTNYVSDGNATYDSDGTKTAYCNHGCGEKETVTDIGSQLVRSEIKFNTLTVNGSNVSGKVPNSQTTYSFINEVNVYGNARYTLSRDIDGNDTIASKTVNLDVGDNTYYIVEYLDNEPQNIFTVTIRRRPIYTVSFNTNGGTAVLERHVEEDDCTEEPTTARTGYMFTEWDYDFNKAIIKDIIVTASWTANQNTHYKAEHYLQNLANNEYTLYETDDLMGTTDTTANAPVKEYQHFTHTVISQSKESGNINGDGSTVLKVYYERDTYAYSVNNENTKGGNISCTASGTYRYETTITLNATVNAGYDFSGWYKDSTLISSNKNYSFNLSATSNITAKYYAHTDTAYVVEYYQQNLANSNYSLKETINKQGSTDTIAYAEIKTYEHFTPTANEVKGNINGDGSTVLKVYYTRDEYAYSVINENTKGGTINCTSNGTYKYEKHIELSATVNAGYDFIGWYINGNVISDELNHSFTLSEVISITARYFAHTDTPYKVEYYLQNLADNNYTLDHTDNLTGTTDTQATAEIKLYEHFTHTIISNSKESANINGNENTVLKVYYTRDKYTVKIQPQDERISISTSYNNEFKYGYTIEEITATFNNYLGYEWKGWYSNNEFITSDLVLQSFTVDKPVNYIANSTVKEEMINFNFSSTKTTCEITGIKYYTVKEIIIPDYVTSIGDKAFYYCDYLQSVTIGNGVRSIGDQAFDFCFYLQSVTIGNGVRSIGDYAFYRCERLTSVTIPDSVTSIGYDAFESCSRLSTVNWNATNCGCAGSSSVPIFNNCSKLTTVNFGKNVNTIPNYAFEGCSSLTSITIPDSVTSIEDWAFIHCSSLTSITIPDSVTSIGKGAFAGCSSLQEITMPFVPYTGNGTMHLGYIFGANSYSDNSSRVPSSLKKIVINGGNSIEDYAFFYCTSLTSVTIPDSVTSIRYQAFYYCSSLTSITIPNSVTSIGSYAFYGCSSLTSVTIPDSVTDIGYQAFNNCSSLTSIIVDGNNEYYKSIDGNLYNKSGEILIRYVRGENETSFTIPDGVTSILTAFSGCSSLTNITIPNSVTNIGLGAFDSCSRLTSITIPDSVTSIGQQAFCRCIGLTSITIPDSVTSIGFAAFFCCSCLESITIPASVMSIGAQAFDGCSSLTRVYYNGTAVDWAKISISSNNDKLTSVTHYYYSETEPELNEQGTAYNGNYWHYVNDEIVIWTKEN